MAAARAWVSGELVAAPREQIDGDGAIADAMAWGATPEELAGLRRHLAMPATGGGMRVWRHNVDIVTAFLLIASQWRTHLAIIDGRPTTVWDGLDYAGVRAGLAGWRLRINADLWAGLMVMEQAARRALNEARA